MNTKDFTENLKHKLESRYRECQPSGGVIYRTPVKGTNLDTYGRGNVHNSIWQYKRKQCWNSPMPFPSDLTLIEKAFKKQKSFTLGYESDAFMWMDIKYGVTLETLKLARQYGVRLSIETISDLVAHEDYLPFIHGHSVCIQLGTGEDQDERINSPGAPSVTRRLKACEILFKAGIHVEVRYGADVPRIYQGKPKNIVPFRRTA